MTAPRPQYERQRQIVTLGVVFFGYLVAFLELSGQPSFPLSAGRVIILILLGGLYVYLGFMEDRLLDVRPAPWKTSLYFAGQLLLILVIELLFGTINGVWLIGMPLVGTAVGRLSFHWQLAVGASILLGLVLPVAWYFSLPAAVSVALSIVPAMLFVALFVRLWSNAEEARRQAQLLADELEDANRQLSLYATQAEELATSRERNRLAREIHDNLGHYLTVINVQLEAAQTIMGQKPEKALDALGTAQRLAQEGLASVRQSVSSLRESPLGDRPLPQAVTVLVEASRNAGIVTEFLIEGEPRRLDPTLELTLYRTVQEGLTNVRKHARASRVDIILDYREAQAVNLTMVDNGIGAEVTENGGFGLLGVQERVALIGGHFAVETAPGQGFKLTISLPE